MMTKSCLLFTLASLILCANSDETEYSYVKSSCSGLNPNPKSSYNSSLHKLLASLKSNAAISSSNGFYTTNSTSDGETIYGAYLCRGDLSLKEAEPNCDGCVAIAADYLPCSTNETTAVIWRNTCMLRYSNQPFLGIVEEKSFNFLNDNVNFSGDVNSKVQLVDKTLSELASETSVPNPEELGAKKYFQTKVVQIEDLTLYTMAQCTPDLDSGVNSCIKCLSLANSQRNKLCGNSDGCRILNPSCFVRYEKYLFYGEEVSPPPTATPPDPGVEEDGVEDVSMQAHSLDQGSGKAPRAREKARR